MTGSWSTMQFGLSPVEGSDLIDDDTAHQATVAIRAAYAAAVELVAPRIHARVTALVAAGGAGDQLITDAEWAAISAQHVEDVLGDGILDGVVAAATQFRQLASPASFAKTFLAAATGFIGYVGQLRGQLNQWIENRIGEGIQGDWGVGDLIRELTKNSPLSTDKADIVVSSELQASTNAGLWAGLQEAQPAAMRWVTRRDERVRPSHVAADKDTIPFGSQFSIDGYLCDYPGDPSLPFRLRVNCRCELAYVDGTEARRVTGSTKAELRTKAAALSVTGRAQMNKGELQAAVLKELCLQGLAGGPDCPDVFDQMNRQTLLTHARGEGISGRYRMTREQLVFQLRQTMRGGDTALVARGYSTKAEFTAAQKKASYKRGRSTAEFSEGSTPLLAARRGSRTALFNEFGGAKTGSVPCVHCGLRLTDNAATGLAVLVPEPIVAWSNGGTLDLSNLVPSCPACFRARGGRGLTSSASLLDEITVDASPADRSLDRLDYLLSQFKGGPVSRDYHGRWTDGPAGSRGPGNSRSGGPAAALADVPFKDVKIAYRPRHPDGHADPGEVVWARVPFEEDKTQSKDRPVLIIGRTADGKNLVGLQLTSKPGAGRRNIGQGDWDKSGRDSYLKFDRFIQVNDTNYRREGSYVKKPAFQELIDTLTKQQHAPDVQLALDRFEFGSESVPRDAGGRWTDGSGSIHKALGEDGGGEYATAAEARDAFTHAVRYLDEHKTQAFYDEHISQRVAFEKAMYGKDKSALEAYTSTGYNRINKALQTGDDAAMPIDVKEQVASLDAMIADHGVPAADGLMRGKGMSSRLRELDWKVGHVFEDRNFGSWTNDAGTASKFTTTDAGTSDITGTVGPRAVVIRMTNSAGIKSIPGLGSESESILPRGIQYEVTGVQDFTAPSEFGVHYRIIDVRAFDKDTLVASGGFAQFKTSAKKPANSGGKTADVARDSDGKWTSGPNEATGKGKTAAQKFGKLVPSKRDTTPAEWLATPAEIAAAKKHVAQKARDVPQPTAEKIAKNRAALDKAKISGRAGGELRGNSYTRRERGQALFEEFGGGKKGKTYVPCGHCGLKVSPGGRNGHALMQQDKILVATEGGDYGTPKNFPNLIPSCGGCNASRNDTPLKTRPRWEKPKSHRRTFGIADSVEFALEDFTVEPALVDAGWARAFPLGWDDPEADSLGQPVVGYLSHRTVTVDWGSYDQWLVGGEVIDKATIEHLAADEAAQFSVQDVPRASDGKWTTGPNEATGDSLLTMKMGDVEDAFTLSGDNYNTEVLSVERSPAGNWKVHTQIESKGGTIIGESERVIRSGPDGSVEVHHASMSIIPEFQGKGIGAEYLRDSVDMYAAHGIDQITTSAVSNEGHANGAYTWAKLGFRLNPAKNGPQNMAQDMSNNEYLRDDTSWTDLADKVRTGTADIADVVAHPLGKDYLTGKYGPVAWNGVLPVKQPALVASADTSTVDFDYWELVELGIAE